ncbi:MAG TPA: Hsp70 family protein [Oculatellaceae cyanobacterium]
MAIIGIDLGTSDSAAEDDGKRRDEADKLNAADALCYQAEKALLDFHSHLSAEICSDVERSMKELRDAIAKRDMDLVFERSENLKKILQQAGASIYAKSVQSQRDDWSSAAEAVPGGAGAGARVVDADYVKTKE